MHNLILVRDAVSIHWKINVEFHGLSQTHYMLKNRKNNKDTGEEIVEFRCYPVDVFV